VRFLSELGFFVYPSPLLHDVNLAGAHLENLDLSFAELLRVDLRGADLRGAKVGSVLWEAKYNKYTRWPDGINPEELGAIKVEEEE
jgi:hypothetical protein